MTMDRTDGELDAAVLAHRADPTPEKHARLLAAGEQHNTAFQREQTEDYQARSRTLWNQDAKP